MGAWRLLPIIDAHSSVSAHIQWAGEWRPGVCVCVCMCRVGAVQVPHNPEGITKTCLRFSISLLSLSHSLCFPCAQWRWRGLGLYPPPASQPASLQARILPLIRPLDYPIPLLKPEQQQRNIIVHVKHSCPVVQSKRNITVVYITFTTINDGNIAIPSLFYAHERLYCSGLRSCIAVIQVHCIHHHCLCDYHSPIGYLR